MPQNPLAKVCLVIAMCEIEIGTECTVTHPDHHDMPSWSDSLACDGQQAVIVGFNPMENGTTSVNIRMKTGSRAGEVVGDVNTKYLRPSGVFRRVSASEEPH